MAKTGLLQSGEIGELRTRDVETALPGFLKGDDFGFDFPTGQQEGIAPAQPLEGGALGAEAPDLPQLEANVNRQLDFILRTLGSKSLDGFPGRKAFRQTRPTPRLPRPGLTLREELRGRVLTPTEELQKEIVPTGLAIQKEQAAFGQRADTEDRLLRREKYKDNNDLRKAQAYFDRYLQVQGLGFKMAAQKVSALTEERQWKFVENWIKQVTQAAEINEKKKELQAEASELMVRRATDTTRPLTERLRVLTDGTALPGNPGTGPHYTDVIKSGKVTAEHLLTVKANGAKGLEIIDGILEKEFSENLTAERVLEMAVGTTPRDPGAVSLSLVERGQALMRSQVRGRDRTQFLREWNNAVNQTPGAKENPKPLFRNLVAKLAQNPEADITDRESKFGAIFVDAARQAAKELTPLYWARESIVGRLDLIDDLNDDAEPKVKQVLQETTTLEEGLTEEDLYERIKNEVIGPDGKPNFEKLRDIAREEMQRVNIGGTSNEIMGLAPEAIGSLWETLGLTGLHDQKQSYFEALPLSMALAEGERFPRSLAEGARLGVLGEVGKEEVERRLTRGTKALVKTIKKGIASKIISGDDLNETDRQTIRQYRSQKEFEKAQGNLTIDELFDNLILKTSEEPESPQRPGPPVRSPG